MGKLFFPSYFSSPLLLTILFAGGAISTSTAFSFSMLVPGPSSPVLTGRVILPEPNFHKVLEQLGKTVLRPGGTVATKKLLAWANLTPNASLLELSAGLGKTGILFAQETGCRVLITDLDQDRLVKAKDEIQQKGMSSIVQTMVVNIFEIEKSLGKDAHFDCAITEASLTHYPLQKKRQFFQDMAKHVDQFLLHEICFRSGDEKIQDVVKRDMQKALKIGFFPETQESWKRLLEEAGFDVEKMEVGDMAVLNPVAMLKDEGLLGAATIFKNITTQPYLRSRVLATRNIISSHSANMGYIVIRATK
jgi:hypothetical protein